MKNYLEYIDAYFNNAMSKEEAILFEKKIEEDKELAVEVAFYLSAKQSLKEQVNLEKKEHFRHLLSQANARDVEPQRAQQISLGDRIRGVFVPRRIMVYRLAIAATILICIFFAGYLFLFRSASPEQLANNYINSELQSLGVKMSTDRDSMQDGLRLYNGGHYDSAAAQFESMIQRDTSNFEAKQYLGIVYLRTANYDKALLYFQQLEHYSLFSNPAVFLQALTLMKRNHPGDKKQARELLRRVVEDDLDGTTTAQEWLRRL